MRKLTGRTGARKVRSPGVNIVPARVRAARLEAGLSLGDMAGGKVSRTTIHLVETGAMRPSMRTLELIARRAGKPVEHFLADVAPPAPAITAEQLDELEAAYEAGRHHHVVDAATDLMPEPAQGWTAAYLRLLIGRSLVRLGKPDQALVELGRARTAFQDLGDLWSAVECIDWIAGALHLQEDPSALGVARRALRECRRLQPMPVELETRVLCLVAAILVSRHDWEGAVEAYAAANRAAGKLRDLRQLALVHDGLTSAFQHLGASAKAAFHSRKALALRVIDRDLSVVARTDTNLGLMLLRSGRLDASREHLRRALDRYLELGLERGRGQVMLSLAELEEAAGRWDEARLYSEDALALARSLGERMTEAAAQMQLGTIAAAGGDAARADLSFQSAIELLSALKVKRRLFECHCAYAEVLERRGDLFGALAQWKLAAGLSMSAEDDLPIGPNAG